MFNFNKLKGFQILGENIKKCLRIQKLKNVVFCTRFSKYQINIDKNLEFKA